VFVLFMEIQQQCKVFGDEHAITSRRNVIKTIIFRKLQTLWTFGTPSLDWGVGTRVWDAVDKIPDRGQIYFGHKDQYMWMRQA